MHDMNRRDFVVATAGGLGLLGMPPRVEALRAIADSQGRAQHAMHVRHDVYCLNPRGREIRSYAQAVTVMRARPNTDPTSWAAQAAIHGTNFPIAGMIVNACKHTSRFFLSWHRMYLYYFERIVRQASGDPAFALPYWGYSPTGDRALPLPFRTPANTTNPLYVAARNASVNAGTPLVASIVDAGTALAQLIFDDFSPSLEGTPHGVVHGAVGGWMGAFATAAQDPIFWLHHANIDRLWDVWIGSDAGRADPADAPWLTQHFDFYDETGAKVTLTGAEVLDDAAQLRYKYAPDACGQGVARGHEREESKHHNKHLTDERQVAQERAIHGRRSLANPVAAGQVAPVSLGPTAVEAALPVTPDARRVLATFTDNPQAGKRLLLLLEDIRVEGTVAVFYEIYVDLSAGMKDTVYTSPHYLGNLDFFGEGNLRRRFNLVPAFLRLRRTNAWSDDSVRLTFVPRGFTEGDEPAKLLGARRQAVIERVSLTIE